MSFNVNEAVALRCSVNQVVLKISQNSQAFSDLQQVTPVQVFSYEFCEVFKNAYC